MRVLSLALLATLGALACEQREPVATLERPEVVVATTSSPLSVSGAGSRAGLAAALAEATAISRLRFALAWLDDRYNDTLAAANVAELVCARGALVVAGVVGAGATERTARALGDIAGPASTPAPLVGALSSSGELRDRGRVTWHDGRVRVVNVRVGGGDEMSAVVSFLSRDFGSLNRTAVVLPAGTAYGSGALAYIGAALGTVGARPWAVVEASPDAQAVAEAVLKAPDHVADKSQRPRAVVMLTTGHMTAPVIAALERRGAVAGMTIVCGSNVAPTSVHAALEKESPGLRRRLSDLGVEIYFLQHVPQPTSDRPLVRDFRAAMNRTGSTLLNAYALEGYAVGRFIAMAATRALEIYGWPLTRQRLLDTVFRSYRTFDLRGVTFGPYGDGAAPQTADDWCNQGAHELYIDRMDLATGQLTDEPSSSFRFAGCRVPNWTASQRVFVGFTMAASSEQQSAADGAVRLGIAAALSASNERTAGDHMVLVATFRANATTRSSENVRRIVRSPALAVVGVSSGAASEALEGLRGADTPLIAPLSGSLDLRSPFRRNVVNVVPLAHQEMSAALQFIANSTPAPEGKAKRVVYLVFTKSSVGTEYNQALHAAANLGNGSHFDVREAVYRGDVLGPSALAVGRVDAIVFAGGPTEAARTLSFLLKDPRLRRTPKMLCSEVPQDLLLRAMDDLGVPREGLEGVHLLSKTPPLAALPRSSELRQQYEQWVSGYDRGESSFRGFFVGAFVSAVVASIDEGRAAEASGPAGQITERDLVDAVYKKRVFDVGGITVGPFEDGCLTRTAIRCCNQGLDRVYVLAWQSGEFTLVKFQASLAECGSEFDVKSSKGGRAPQSMLGITLALSLGLGAAAVLLAVLTFVFYSNSKKLLSFLNIKRPDLEINERIGRGRQGPLHVGDWHGTTVVIRVIDKKAITKAEQTAIKEEIGLLHKLHHPNLLMLMGYCETRNELYVVSEYMSGGSLKEYLARNRGQLGVFSLIAMAFDVVKGIAYLHASKPPIVHGSISTRSLLVDDKLTTKVSDFWLSRMAEKERTGGASLPHSSPMRTQEWMAPEVSSGLLVPASDVWAFGIVLWELFQSNMRAAQSTESTALVSGPVSASKSSSSSIPMSVQVAPHPEPDASTPKEVVELLYQCWEPQPDQRPTIFTVLRSWPSTFASIGRFELPSDLSQAQITDDSSRTSETGPDAVVPVAMMSHSEREAAQSLHFEFQTPSEMAGTALVSLPSLPPLPALLLLPLLLCAACARAGTACGAEPSATTGAPAVVVGVTSPAQTTSGANSRLGLACALRDASAISRLRFELRWLDDAGDASRSAANARALACNGTDAAMVVAATVGSASSEAVLAELRGLEGPAGTRVPLVGALSSSPDLRDPALVAGADGRLGVVNVRSEAVDEMSAVLSFLSRDFGALNRTAVVALQTPYAELSTAYLRVAFANLRVDPWAFVNLSTSAGPADVAAVVDELLAVPAAFAGTGLRFPRDVVLVSTRTLTAPIIAAVSARGAPNVTFVCGANPGPTDVFAALSAATRAALKAQGSQVYFQQHVPQPSSSSALISEFWASYNATTTAQKPDADMLEGYIVGRLITTAAMRALEIYGWPLTRARFLDAVYRSYRTFDLRGTVYGPYGDGVAPQSADDLCNHGLHELFMDRMDLDTGALIEEASTSFKFAGCNVPNWTLTHRAVIGFSLAETGGQSDLDGAVRLGLSAALSAANSVRTTKNHIALVANFRGDSVTDNVKGMIGSSALAVVGLDSLSVSDAVAEAAASRKVKEFPIVAPLSGSFALRFPFSDSSDVVNLVPLMKQEARVALSYLRASCPWATRIAVVYEPSDASVEYKNAVVEVGKNISELHVTDVQFTDSTGSQPGIDAYVFAGQSEGAAVFLANLYADSDTRNKTKMLCSDVLQDLLVAAVKRRVGTLLNVMVGAHLLCSTPPLAMLSKSHEARQQYEQWVSEIDRGESSFRGFFVGLFFNAIIDAVDNTVTETGSPPHLTSKLLVETVYTKKVFDVGGFSVGSFTNVCEKGTGVRCSNQGLDRVYITQWQSGEVFGYVSYDVVFPLSGFDPTDYRLVPKKEDNLGLTLGLALGLGVAVLFIVLLSTVFYAHSRRTLSFLNIKRPDLEINECIGKGRLGAVHVGDWHGTTVAIKVIDKKKVNKGDLATIKEEIGLLHKLHHPNLLMLMGYCETRNELYVVSEYMSGGSLKEYLARNRGQLAVFTLIAMAFDVVKGIAYLHASKPPIVHGSISTRSLMIDDKLTTKVSDFWFSRTAGARKSSSGSHSKELKSQEWLAPEVATGILTQATDVWAFGVVLWELFQSKQGAPAAPAKAATSGPVTASKSSSSSSSVPLGPIAQHPEPDATTPKEVVELLYQCWEPQPDRRPTIFTVLRSWPATFASIGQFELPSDFSQLHITDDSRTSGPGPEAVVPVLMMSHSEPGAGHFEFQSPEIGGTSVLSTPSGLVGVLPSPGSSNLAPDAQMQSLGLFPLEQPPTIPAAVMPFSNLDSASQVSPAPATTPPPA
eukprot:m51a1_g2839 putative flag-tagged protein kinase domain of mitogen-activated protein kinase kinase kinase (2521) ;mRNA; r:264462-273306